MKAFLASFLATLIILLALHQSDELAIGTRAPDAVAAPARQNADPIGNVDNQSPALALLRTDCDVRLESLLVEFPLAFDHLSEQLKSDSLQLIHAIAEVSADCPYSVLQIRSQITDDTRESRIQLNSRRARFLENRFRKSGLITELIDADPTITNDSDFALTLAFKHP